MKTDPLNIEPLLEALSLIIAYTPLEQKEFVNRFRYTLVHTIKKEFPNASIAEISQNIGMLRGKISDCLDEEEMPKVAPSNEMHILNSLWQIKDESNLVDFKGENSFYSISRKQLVGKHSPETALNILINSSSVAHHSENKLIIISREITIGNDKKQLVRIISDVFSRLVKTVLWNVKNKDKLYQNTIVTKRVHPRSIKKLRKKTFAYLKGTTMVDLRNLIESFEDSEEEEEDYPEYSVSIIEFFNQFR